ncbi:hypothetical protein [Methanobrevibacter filiformis]|uniref:DNA topoisomerase I n=1 Tax=Methanobrevibacter filiformis TaxID=55758 RepID=A0A166A9T0_9EURY|nr:hypothetical protein [Methanobrevibacter filiformis]KZX11762.1 hypothetical protein MBFIL_13240 [Methanobrevibacter filiformis]
MGKNNDLYDFDTSCPECGSKTMKKTIGLCNFTVCTNFFSCSYSNIDEMKSMIENPSEERVNMEKEWYNQRLNIFKAREKRRLKEDFIAKEMEKLKVKEMDDKELDDKENDDKELDD